MDLADLDNNSIASSEAVLREAKVKDNATAIGDEVRCTIPGFDHHAATDPMQWVPFVTSVGIFYPKVGDRAVIAFPDEGPPAIVLWEPRATVPDAGLSAVPTGAAGGDLTGTFPDPQIGSGVIVNGDVNAAAAIAYSKLNLATSIKPGDIAALEAWNAATFKNSWENYEPTFYTSAAYRKGLDGRVYLRGIVKKTSGAAGTTMLTLPVGMRPTKILMFTVLETATSARVDVEASGAVNYQGGSSAVSFLSLNGVSFYPE